MPLHSPEVSIVVPVYNSASTIRTLVSRMYLSMHSAGLTYELILVDDHSTDATWQEILEICQSGPNVYGFRLDHNCGQWCSTLVGVKHAEGRYIVTIDDDLEYYPEDIPALYHAITHSNHAIVFGISQDKYRLQGKNPRYARLRNVFLNFLWNKPPSDSFKILKREVVFNKGAPKLQQPLDVFITHHLDREFWGYHTVRFSRRYAGSSNYPLSKKIPLFFLYSSFFLLHPFRKIFATTAILLMSISVALFLFAAGHLRLSTFISLGMIVLGLVVVDLYYIIAAFSRPTDPYYSIAAAVQSIDIGP